jgi:thioredoxin 1
MMSENILVLTDETFDKTLAENSLPVLVDFWAPWCTPCRSIAPILDELAGEMSSRLVFAKMNVDENGDTPTKLNVRSIPCLILFKSGAEAGRLLGGKGKQVLQDALEKLL